MTIKMTIIIPCYNAGQWLTQCINSALDQTYENKEIIFVDNESTDGSLEVARNIQKERGELIISTAPNIYKYSYQEPVEEALRIATGDYFTIFGADDYAELDYIEKVVSLLNAGGDKIRFLQTPVRGIQADTGKLVGEIKYKYKSLSEFKDLLFKRCPVTTPTMIFKKELYDNGTIEWNSEEYLGAVDYDVYFRLADKGEFIYPCPKWLGYYYRWHDGQATWGMHKETNNYDKIIQDFWRNKWNL